MKTIHIFLLVAFLAFEAKSNPNPSAKEDVKGKIKDIDDPESAALQADEEGFKAEETKRFQAAWSPCYGGSGYCLPRQYICATGLVFKEQYNSCPEKERNKCCLLPGLD